MHVKFGPLAQLAEQQTLNLRVAGSMPARLIGMRRDGESRPAFILSKKSRFAAAIAFRRYRLGAITDQALTAKRAAFTMRRIGKGSMTDDARVVEWQTRQT